MMYRMYIVALMLTVNTLIPRPQPEQKTRPSSRHYTYEKSSHKEMHDKGSKHHTGCPTIKTISSLPFIISQPGKYCLAKNLTYAETGAAITIQADDVFLDFNHFTIDLESAQSTVVLILGSKVTIENDLLGALHSSNNIGLHVLNTRKVTLQNNLITGFNNAILIENSTDVLLVNSKIDSAATAVSVLNSKAVVIRDCSFSNNVKGLRFDQGCKDCLLSNVIETNADFGTFFRWIDGLIIENSIFEVTSPTNGTSCIQFGSPFDSNAVAHDILLNNCQFINRLPINPQDPTAGFDGVLFAVGSHAIMQNCIIDINAASASGSTVPYVNAALHLSGSLVADVPPDIAPTRIFTDVQVINCVIINKNGMAFTTENGTKNVVIQDSLVGSSVTAINLIGATGCVVKNSEIQNNTGNAVVLDGSNAVTPIVPSRSNAILNNVVANNTGIGVYLTPNSSNNLIQANQVFSNTVLGINNIGGISNRILNNTAYNNGANPGDNYRGVTIVNYPGNPTVVGENIVT